MRIELLDTRIVELSLPRPIGTAIHRMDSVGCVLLTVRTSDGAEGEAFAFTLNGDRIAAFDEMIRGMSPYVIGADVRDVERVWADIWAAANPTGWKGVTIAALSTIDVAMWDAFGHIVGQPLAKLFGGARDRVDTYASSGLWLSQSIEELTSEAAGFIDLGFRGMKIRVGSPKPQTDVERVAAVRSVIGPDVALYADVNQGLSPKGAIALGHALEPFDLAWIEEPVSAHDLQGHARVRDALTTPVASGETEYSRFGMNAMLEAGSVDVLMPDLQRIGGFTEFRRTAAIASVHHVPISSHFFTEYSLSMAGSLENCALVEHIDWFAPLFDETPQLVDGQLLVPTSPGTGFRFST
ncbi:MAG: mandelate racemase/muconate lactonizing enzyme family protein [Acidimicrobiales bacterium]